ncbi:glycosyltransferase family 2 protein [Mucilaginibacter sp. ZT4R22]|uniref:Glycosyltransferase family 2 protein n=1 Tax=Mucilaginibacter pankratovii TaxID=2772110 RepID=A0ABR7WNT6_9SPHI|nr:glycosyltransferase [Mucilaginibacter pankratovii]MBD1363980.1 glycosyltransferase family 2 protein [Mucilaginibacter pankratovii]
MPAGVSVLICCYNSAGRLPATLKHLSAQQVPAGFNWEIIVIDNASDDNTATFAKQLWNDLGKTDINFTVLTEPKAGKTNALHTGITAAAYHYILICDDDNWLADDYVTRAFHRMQRDPAIGAAGGRGFAVTDGELPAWFTQYQHGYAVGEQNSVTGDISGKGYLWGAGMIFRKQLYHKTYLNFPSFLTGPNGDTLARGEDVEFCLRILLAGYTLFYDEGLRYKHYIPTNRLTVAYRDKLFKGYDYEKTVLDLYSRQIKLNALSWFGRQQLLFSSISRYVLSGLSSKWKSSFEADMIYLAAGYQFSTVSKEVKQIRELNLQLAAKTHPKNA